MRYVGQIGGNGEDGWLVFPFEAEPVAFVFFGGAMLNVWREVQDWVTDVRNTPGGQAGATSMHVYAHGTGGRGSEFPIIHPPSRRIGMSERSLAAFERVMNIDVKPGMILAFEPHVTFDKKHGLHLGDPVLVTNTGCRRLSKLTLQDWVAAE